MLNFNKELQNILEVAIPVLIKKKEQLQIKIDSIQQKIKDKQAKIAAKKGKKS